METLRHNSIAAHDSLYMTGLLLIQLLGCLLSKPYVKHKQSPDRHLFRCSCADQLRTAQMRLHRSGTFTTAHRHQPHQVSTLSCTDGVSIIAVGSTFHSCHSSEAGRTVRTHV